jgi:hypothetical protein
VFAYIGQDDVQDKKEYVKNIIVILNSVFEYGFIRAITNRDETFSEDEDDYDVEFESDREQTELYSHYWEYITVHFSDLDSVRYINFYYKEANTSNEKSLGWLMLTINQPKELGRVFLESFCNT